MAFIQKNTPPPNKVYSFSLGNFVGGINNTSNQLLPNEARDLLNMAFADDTLMEKRYGFVYLDESDLEEDITFIDEYKPYNDDNIFIKASDKNVYMNDVSIQVVNGRVSGVNYNGKYYFADGEKLYCYGKFPQKSVSPYVVVDGTAVDDYVVFEVVNPPSNYTPLDNSHTQGVVHYNYTKNQMWYEPCDNEITDTYKGANYLPEKPKFLTVHKGRLIITGCEKDDDNVFISDINNANYFPVSLPIQLPPNSDKIKGVRIFDDSIVIGRNDDVYAISGSTNNPNMGFDVFTLRKLNTHCGFMNNTSIDVVNNYLFYLGSDGNVYALSSTKYDNKTLVTTIISKQINLFKKPFNYTLTDMANANSIYYKDEWYLTIGNRTFIYSYRHKAWTVYSNMESLDFYNLDGELIWSREGRLAKQSDDTYIDYANVPYQAYWISKNFDMDDPSTYKQFKEFFLVAHVYNDFTSDIDIMFEIDYVDILDKQTLTNQIAVWGRAKWGDRFINKNIVASLPLTIGRRGRTISFKFSNGYEPLGTVNDVGDLDLVLGKKEGMLIYVTNEAKYYLYTNFEWIPKEISELNQAMKLYQVNGDYELRGKR